MEPSIALDATILAALTTGFDSILGIITSVLVVAIPTVVSVLALTKGAQYGIKWINKAFSKG